MKLTHPPRAASTSTAAPVSCQWIRFDIRRKKSPNALSLLKISRMPMNKLKLSGRLLWNSEAMDDNNFDDYKISGAITRTRGFGLFRRPAALVAAYAAWNRR